MVLGITAEEVDAGNTQGLGSLIHALSIGIVIQNLLNPNSAPTGDQILRAFETVWGPYRAGGSAPAPRQRGAAASPSTGGEPVMDEVGESEEVACAAEIERLYRILRDWLSGNVAGTDTELGEFADGVGLGHHEVVGGFRRARGSALGLRIEIRDTRLFPPPVSWSWPLYRTVQRRPRRVFRRCTVVFERDPLVPRGLRWWHL